MTAKFETVLDAVRTAVTGLTGFTTKTELPNPYDVAANPEPMLRDSWGLRIGASASGPTEFNTLVDAHEFALVLTREVIRTDNDTSALMTAVKALKADAVTLQRNLDGGDGLGLGDTLERFTYNSTSAVEFGEAERHKWVTVTVSFIAHIREDLA